jgi:hypothetical protein
LLVVEKTDKGRFLHQMDPGAGKKSTVEIEKNGDIVQPAASSPHGEIFLAIGTTLFCFQNGKELWRHHFETVTQPILFTVLADNSALSVSGHFVFLTESDGKQTFEKFVIPEISCRPIIDADGRIYIGGKGGILCLK